jgi:hypothetical protein
MGTVTAYNMSNIQSALGGSNPISLSEYYRGGAYVPTTRSTTVREPTSGEYYNWPSNPYTWWERQVGVLVYVRWFGTLPTTAGQAATSVSAGGYTYFRGSYRQFLSDPYGNSYELYGIYRTSGGTTSINTGVPSSGTISISQLYGAENP